MVEIEGNDQIVILQREQLDQVMDFMEAETSLNLVESVVGNLNQTPVALAEEEEDAINFFIFNRIHGFVSLLLTNLFYGLCFKNVLGFCLALKFWYYFTVYNLYICI